MSRKGSNEIYGRSVANESELRALTCTYLFLLNFPQSCYMFKTRIAGIGMYVPAEVVTNDDLAKVMDTSDEWIQERTGIRERRFAKRYEDTTTTMGVQAAKIAMQRAEVTAQDIDFIIFATLSPDYYFPGC